MTATPPSLPKATATTVSPAVSPSAWTMLRAMGGVGFVCGLLIAGAYVGTRATIERNRAEALRAAIFEVLPQARSHETLVWLDRQP